MKTIQNGLIVVSLYFILLSSSFAQTFSALDEQAFLQLWDGKRSLTQIIEALYATDLVHKALLYSNESELLPQKVYLIIPDKAGTCQVFLLSPFSPIGTSDTVSTPSRIAVLTLQDDNDSYVCSSQLFFRPPSEAGDGQLFPASNNTRLLTSQEYPIMPIVVTNSRYALSIAIKHYYIAEPSVLHINVLHNELSSVPRSYLSFGVGPALVYQPDKNFVFYGDTARFEGQGMTFRTAGRLTMSILPGRAKSDEYKFRESLWRRLSVESGIGLLLNQFFLGLGFTVFEPLEITYGWSFGKMPNPDEQVITTSRSPTDVERLFPTVQAQHWFIGLRIDLLSL